MTDDNSIPAFPSHGSMGEVVNTGMTLRDYFAAMAMQGQLSDGCAEISKITACAYRIADSMLEARKS